MGYEIFEKKINP